MNTSSFTKVDFHCHTTHSDGKDTPEILVQKAKQVGLQMVAVTDHDRVNREARKLLAEAGILSLDSVEISAKDYERGQSLHILMYSAHISERTDEILREIRQSRTVKIQKQCEQLAKYGFEISFPELCAYAERIGIAPDCLNNGTIALFLLGTEANRNRAEAIAGRKIQTMTEMIGTFLKENSEFPEIGYVKIDDYEIGIDEVIALAKHENALLSIAHPNFSFEKYGGLAGFEEAMREYRERGIEGIEYNALAPVEWEQLTRKLADEIDCILTFGSDYHGDSDDRHSEIGGIHPSLQESPELLEKNLGKFGERVFKIIE